MWADAHQYADEWFLIETVMGPPAPLVKGFDVGHAALSNRSFLETMPSMPSHVLKQIASNAVKCFIFFCVYIPLLLQRYYAPNNWGKVVSLAAIPSNLYFVVGYEYGSIRIWSLELGFRLRRLRCWEGDLIQALRTSTKTMELDNSAPLHLTTFDENAAKEDLQRLHPGFDSKGSLWQGERAHACTCGRRVLVGWWWWLDPRVGGHVEW